MEIALPSDALNSLHLSNSLDTVDDTGLVGSAYFRQLVLITYTGCDDMNRTLHCFNYFCFGHFCQLCLHLKTYFLLTS